MFAKLQKNIKRLQSIVGVGLQTVSLLTNLDRVNFVDLINRKLYSALIIPHLKTSTDTICIDEWRKAEKTANDIERENQQLRIENSRLVREATRANRKSTVELVRDEFVGGW